MHLAIHVQVPRYPKNSTLPVITTPPFDMRNLNLREECMLSSSLQVVVDDDEPEQRIYTSYKNTANASCLALVTKLYPKSVFRSLNRRLFLTRLYCFLEVCKSGEKPVSKDD